MGAAKVYTVQWGGYYATQGENGDYRVFRLLDFNLDAYHSSLFSETFAQLPTLDEVLALSASIMHVPIDARGFVTRDHILLGSAPLDRDALAGYIVYLEAHGGAGDELNELLDRLIDFSQSEPMRAILEIVDGELTAREPD